jgi:hypothetical protein
VAEEEVVVGATHYLVFWPDITISSLRQCHPG